MYPSHLRLQGTLCVIPEHTHSISPINSNAQKCIPCYCFSTSDQADSTRYTLSLSFPPLPRFLSAARSKVESLYKHHSIPLHSSPIPSTSDKNPSLSPASGDPRNSDEPLSVASVRFSDIHARPRCTGFSVHTCSIVGRRPGSRRIRPRMSVISAALQC